MTEQVAEDFIMLGIQEWGQSDESRVAAVQGVLDAAGFEATATCWPVFGGIWPKACEGPQGEEATAWLKHLTDTLQPERGDVHREVAHVAKVIAER